MNDHDENDIPLLMQQLIPEVKSIKAYKQIVPVCVYHFYIHGEIQDVEPYLELINTLKIAEPHDTIFIYINSPGGDIQTAVQIMSAMNQSRAGVVTSIEGLCASAATMIFLSGQRHIVNKFSSMMIHNYSQHGTGGKGNELAIQIKFQEGYFKKLAKDIYGNFLTSSEIIEMLNGVDFWFDTEQIRSRLQLIEDSKKALPTVKVKVAGKKGNRFDKAGK